MRLLVREGAASGHLADLVAFATDRGVPVSVETPREMLRMSETGAEADVLGIVGVALATDLAGLMASEGVALILAGVRYPGNVGFILRSAEVAGAAGVVVDNEWPANGRQWSVALRTSIRAERFLPVLACSAAEAVRSARHAGRRVVAVETSGDRDPWSLDWTEPIALVLGGEAEGLSSALLLPGDLCVRIPTRGVIPSYNVQAATSILLGEWLRQTSAG